MRKPRAYVETTIPSFYAERRTAPEIVARRKWWADASERYELVTSPAVLVVVSFPLRVSPLCEFARGYLADGAVDEPVHVPRSSIR